MVTTGGGRRPGEFDLISRHLKPLARHPGALGLADDAARLVPRPGEEWVITNDMLVETVHFLDDPPAAIAAKTLRVNLSDLAAKGARPVAYLLALGLADRCDEDWIRGFAAGLQADQERFGVALFGGDTVRSGDRIVLSVTAFGALPAGTMVHRAGARPGDILVVSGTIGDAALAVRIRLGRPAPVGLATAYLLDRYLYPQPRVALAEAVRRYANASMDVSDGLIGDLGHLCRESGVTGEIDAAAVPLSEEARAFLPRDPTALETILTGGDDYEILASVPPENLRAYFAAGRREGIALTAIGRVIEGRGSPVVRSMDGSVVALARPSWVHF